MKEIIRGTYHRSDPKALVREVQQKYLKPTQIEDIIEKSADEIIDSDVENHEKISSIETIKQLLNDFVSEQKRKGIEEMLNEEERRLTCL